MPTPRIFFFCCLTLCCLSPLGTYAYAAVSITQGKIKSRSADHPKSLSGITYAGNDTYYMVADSTTESGLYTCNIKLSANGKKISSLTIPPSTAALRLPGGSDLEACAFDPVTGNVWVSSETKKTVKEYNPRTGAAVSELHIPAVIKKNINLEKNLGIEGLTIAPDGKTLWLCNEEALRVDGKRSSVNNGTTVRLVKYTRLNNNKTFIPVAMYAYTTDKWVYGESIASTARGGVSALSALPDGSLLVLERQLSFKTRSKWTSAFSNSLSWKIYRISDFSEVTDISDFPRLEGAKYTPVRKTLLAQNDDLLTSTGNFEGLCLGPRLADGALSLIIVSDAGDGYSKKQIQPLVLRMNRP